MTLELIWAGVCALLLVDNIRLRRKQLAQEVKGPPNHLPDGTLLPEPDDPRWQVSRAQYDGEDRSVARLGTVAVMFYPQRVFIDGHPIVTGQGVEAYVEAVQVAYVNRRSLEAVMSEESAMKAVKKA